MLYKQKVKILSALVLVLAGVYIVTIVFDPERSGQRSDVYTWLDSSLRDSIDRIDLSGTPDGNVTLFFRSGEWVVDRDGRDYPAQQGRVYDLLDALSRQDAFPLRSNTPSSHERFGLSDAAARIILRGGVGVPLLDLLVGNNDAGGRNVFLRKSNSNDVRSGQDLLTVYTRGQITAWYNLRIFPEQGDSSITADLVQRITLHTPPGETEIPDMVITRNQNSWRIDAGDLSLGAADIDKNRVDSYVSAILNTTGDDFVFSPGSLDDGWLRLELGDGRVLTLRIGPLIGEDGRRDAALSDAGAYVYNLSAWALERLLRKPDYFRN
jgi:hypothetical protein